MERTIKADMALATSAAVDRVEQFSQKRETMSAKRPMVTCSSSYPPASASSSAASARDLFVVLVCLKLRTKQGKKNVDLEIDSHFMQGAYGTVR